MYPSWLDEVDFDPNRATPAMGTRRLGNRPWLVADSDAAEQMELKRRLTQSHHDAVFAMAAPEVFAQARSDARLVAELVARHTPVPDELRPVADSLPDLARAGLSCQEDLCLLSRLATGWHLAGASLHFPSRWRLREKLGRHITAIHGPVPGYGSSLAARVDSLLDALGTEPVWRRNWFVHDRDELFQPYSPNERLVRADDCLAALTLRSERQTLRRVGDSVLFTIRIQRIGLAGIARSAKHVNDLGRFVSEAGSATLRSKGLSVRQAEELALALSRFG